MGRAFSDEQALMTDTEEQLDLSVLARVAPDEQDEKPDSRASGGVPPGPADEPPRPRRRGPRARASTPPDPQPLGIGVDDVLPDYRPGMFVEPFTKAYMTVSAMVMPFNEPVGLSIAQNAEQCAKAWDNAAKMDKRIRVYLLRAMVGGAVVPLLIAHLPILTVIGVTMFPAKRLGGVESTGQTETVNPVSNGYSRR